MILKPFREVRLTHVGKGRVFQIRKKELTKCIPALNKKTIIKYAHLYESIRDNDK